jgi:PPOX class probable F420-dependent enzyme
MAGPGQSTQARSATVGAKMTRVELLSAAKARCLRDSRQVAGATNGRPSRQRRCQSHERLAQSRMEAMPSQIPASIHGQKYISLTTFRKSGAGVATPVWFGEGDGKLYVMTRGDMGKAKRIRNNPHVRVAPCTMRGTVTGAEVAATARILPAEEHARARQTINQKYWMARIPLIWSRTDTYFELSFG